MNLETWQSHFEGYTLVGCAVGNRNTLYLLGKANPPEGSKEVWNYELTTRFVFYMRDDEDPDNRWGSIDFNMLDYPMLAAVKKPESQAVIVDDRRWVFSFNLDGDQVEPEIPKSLSQGGSVTRLKEIEGYLYAVDSGRCAFYRESSGKWIGLEEGHVLTQFDGSDLTYAPSFEDIDGFSRCDIYAVGGKGDVWHWNGARWSQCHFPSNMYLTAVCCGEDGKVYIGAQCGTVFVGRGDDWQMLQKNDYTLPFKDMVWYEDRVWCTSDYGVYQIVDGKFTSAVLPLEAAICAGNLSVGDGVLLLAGVHGAAFLENGKWESLVNNPEMRQLAENP
ncbi:hypothetical protein [Chitinimonas lacunae]|uniref:Uncharacterized protein n=1 Tax=Chitinimonas lacunae TaxID=1963018 RepID=A0ABV8MMN0_9NEIS